MELTRHHAGGKVHVRAVDESGITVADQTYRGSVILSPEAVKPDWPVERLSDISEEALQHLLALSPEIVIIGTGKAQHFLAPHQMMVFHGAGIGIEVMNTRAACRTFNVLVMEERRVVAALMPPDSG